MRILHIITDLRTGGAEKLMVDLLPLMNSADTQTELLLINGETTPFLHLIKQKGVRVYSLGESPNYYHPKHIWRLRSFLKRFDIIHTHNTSPQLFSAIANLGLHKVLVTTEHNTSNRRRGNKLLALLDHWMYRQYKRIISISPETAKNLQNHCSIEGDKIITISNGVCVSAFATAIPSGVLKEIAPTYKCSILMVARFRHQKDHDTLIKSLKYLPQDYHVFLIGDGEREPALRQLADKAQLSHQVHFLGVRTDVANIMKAADIIVQSSHWEGFGLAAVEGMAAAKPVIASNVEGLAQVVEGAGLLFEKGNDKQLAQLILQLSEDKNMYQSVSEKCRERAQKYDISKMAEAYLRVYRELL